MMRRVKNYFGRVFGAVLGMDTTPDNSSRSRAICLVGPNNGASQPMVYESSPQKAVQACREAIGVLNKQEFTLQTQANIAETEARALLRLGDRGGAETALKKREIVLREIDRLHRTRMSLLSQILLVETAKSRQIAVEALASGVAAHRKMSRKLFEETQLEKLEDALTEQAFFEDEISGILGQGFDAITNFDDETCLNLKKSLAELEQDEVANALAGAGFQGICSAESYQGTNTADLQKDPSRIDFPVEPSSLRKSRGADNNNLNENLNHNTEGIVGMDTDMNHLIQKEITLRGLSPVGVGIGKDISPMNGFNKTMMTTTDTLVGISGDDVSNEPLLKWGEGSDGIDVQ